MLIATTHGIQATFHALTATTLPSEQPRLATARTDGHAVLWRDTAARVNAALATVGHDAPFDTAVVAVPTLPTPPPASADVAVAVELLTARGALPQGHALAQGVIVLGELRRDGTVLPVRAVAPILRAAVEQKGLGLRMAVVPRSNAREAASVDGIELRVVGTLSDVLELARGYCPRSAILDDTLRGGVAATGGYQPDMVEVYGCEVAKRVLTIAAAGGHSVLLLGDEGSGAVTMARRLPTIMAPMTAREAAQCTDVASVSGLLTRDVGAVVERPFRAPHHTVSARAILGVGERPGEVTLAHGGVLLLDRVLEFRPGVVEWALYAANHGQSVIQGGVTAPRVAWPAKTLVVGTSWLCACGRSALSQCRCSGAGRLAWEARRRDFAEMFDLAVKVDPHATTGSACDDLREPSIDFRARVEHAKAFAAERTAREGLVGGPFADRAARKLIEQDRAMGRVDAVIRVARTIADLAGSAEITDDHASEAERYVPRTKPATFIVRRHAEAVQGAE
jgi:magnesium chelatase family protein